MLGAEGSREAGKRSLEKTAGREAAPGQRLEPRPETETGLLLADSQVTIMTIKLGMTLFLSPKFHCHYSVSANS